MIDVHVRQSPKAYTDAMARYAGQGRSPGWSAQPHTDSPEDVARRLELMDEAGVDLQVQSHGIMNPYLRSEHEAIEAARACNDGYADLAARYPNRFAALVSLPLPHVDAALRELERGMDDLGMAGVGMNCYVFERSTAEGEFEPLCAEMDRRRAMLFFHPIGSGICSQFIAQYGLTGAAGTSMEDATIVLHLIVRQIPTR